MTSCKCKAKLIGGTEDGKWPKRKELFEHPAVDVTAFVR